MGVLWDARLELTGDIQILIFATCILALVGLWDDFRALTWKWQLLWQVLIGALVIVVSGISILPFFDSVGIGGAWGSVWALVGAILAGLWIVSIINALNWIDGVDGLAPGVIVVCALVLALVAMRPEVMQPPVAIVALTLAGAIAALWVFNMFPARFFLGTAGVYASGFVLAYLSVFAGAKVATAMLVLAVPLADMTRVCLVRMREKRSLALPDANHIHHTLAKRGWNESLVSVFLLCLTALAGVLALVFTGPEKILAMGMIFGLIVGLFWWVSEEEK